MVLHTGDKEEAMKFFPAPGEELPEKPVQEIIALHKAAAFPCSFAKVQRRRESSSKSTS